MWGPKQNLDPICFAILTFIGNQQSDRHTYINKSNRLNNIWLCKTPGGGGVVHHHLISLRGSNRLPPPLKPPLKIWRQFIFIFKRLNSSGLIFVGKFTCTKRKGLDWSKLKKGRKNIDFCVFRELVNSSRKSGKCLFIIC